MNTVVWITARGLFGRRRVLLLLPLPMLVVGLAVICRVYDLNPDLWGPPVLLGMGLAVVLPVIAEPSTSGVEIVVDATGAGVVQVQATDYSAFIRALPRLTARNGIRLLEVRPADESLESVFSYLVAR